LPDNREGARTNQRTLPWVRIAALGLLIFVFLCCLSAASLSGLLLLIKFNDSIAFPSLGLTEQEPTTTGLDPVAATPDYLTPGSTFDPPGNFQSADNTSEFQLTEEALNQGSTLADSTIDRLSRIKPPAEIDQQSLSSDAHVELETMWTTDLPARDYYEVATRLGGATIDSRIVNSAPPDIGDIWQFWTDSGSIEAILVSQTEHANFWFDQELQINKDVLTDATQRFENDQYPVLSDLWGFEWRPGVDGDPRFSVLHLAEFKDSDELGYFDSSDEYPDTVVKKSNEQEIIYLNMDALELGSDIYFATLHHELQHLIQWHNDANESAWLNEGLSQLTELYLGFDTVDTIHDYLSSPEIRLNSWSYEDEDVLYAHYGAAYLFSVYFWEQLGKQAVSELADHPANGMAAVRDVLKENLPNLDLSSFVGNWALANYLDDERFGDKYLYNSLDLDQPAHFEQVRTLPYDEILQLNQFGVHYVKLDTANDLTITFAGDRGVPIIDAAPHSGQKMWWAPPISELDARLDGAFDLSGVNSASLDFWTWYDLEDGYDFGYVSVSTDSGKSWELLVPNHASAGQYGPGFSGRSSDLPNEEDGWIFESISLNSYLGQEIVIRFETLTDSAITGAGMAIDDISIPELDYYDNVEDGPNSWQNSGFVATDWRLPQEFSVYLIQEDPALEITPLALNSDNQGSWNVSLGDDGGVLAVVALAPHASAKASYWLSIVPYLGR
jgi:immune inhibitor A